MIVKPFFLLLGFFALFGEAASAAAINGTWTGELKSGVETVPAIYKFAGSGNPIYVYETRNGTREAELTHLTDHAETGLLKCGHGIQVIDARDLGQGLDRHLNFTDFFAPKLILDHGEILANSVLDVLNRLSLRSPL